MKFLRKIFENPLNGCFRRIGLVYQDSHVSEEMEDFNCIKVLNLFMLSNSKIPCYRKYSNYCPASVKRRHLISAWGKLQKLDMPYLSYNFLFEKIWCYLKVLVCHLKVIWCYFNFFRNMLKTKKINIPLFSKN